MKNENNLCFYKLRIDRNKLKYYLSRKWKLNNEFYLLLKNYNDLDIDFYIMDSNNNIKRDEDNNLIITDKSKYIINILNILTSYKIIHHNIRLYNFPIFMKINNKDSNTEIDNNFIKNITNKLNYINSRWGGIAVSPWDLFRNLKV